ncbi:MAG TPA: AzlD domain-containing protein [Acidimicrobiales bacterium]|jgi:branched-subunit amino acid transport protein|nr:AzlD domain-containing protein [Acidimicrobiales bacterium]
MTAVATVLVAGLGSYLLRLSMVGAGGRIRWLPQIERAAHLVVPMTFAALATGGILASTGGIGIVPPIAAVGAGAVSAQRTGRPYAAIAVGMPTLWVLNALVGA